MTKKTVAPKAQKVSEEILQKYQALNPEGKQVPPSMTRNEAWVLKKIAEFEKGEPAASQEAPVPSNELVNVAEPEKKEAAPAVSLPTATKIGKVVGHKQQVMTKEMIETKKKLGNSELVLFMIPKAEWEPVGVYETVTINGYRMEIKKGIMMKLPMPVFKLLSAKYLAEQEAGADKRITGHPGRVEALT